MLTKVNELIDETTATGPGKCHCCGEDLETAHLVGIHVATIFCLKPFLERRFLAFIFVTVLCSFLTLCSNFVQVEISVKGACLFLLN
jgi:hypothetical protein